MIRKLSLLVLLAIVILPSPPARGQDEFAEVAERFNEVIGEELNTDYRVSSVGKVAAFDHRDAAKTLMDALELLSGKVDIQLRNLARLEAAHQEVNTNQDVARDDYETRDRLRAEIMELDGRLLSHRKVLEAIRAAAMGFRSSDAQGYVAGAATGGKDWRQRGIAAQAAAVYPTPEGRTAALRALRDKEPRVVIQALYGLRDRKDPETADAVIACLKSEVWVVQSVAAEVLGAIRVKQAVRPLIEALGRTEGRVQDDIKKVLQDLTGEKLEADYESWKAWYEEHKAEYEGEDAKPLAKSRPRKESDEDSTYYGIPVPSKHIVYLIDISGSMTLEIGGAATVTPREGEEERVSGPKIEIAKNELKNAIRKLPENAYFNIITFNHLVKTWEQGMMQATQKNKNRAYLFIRDLHASGSTYTYGALKEAFKLAGMGATDPNYDSGVDTIFLLSDGAPTDQSFPTSKLMDPDEILEAVRQWNALSKVVIHAIAIDPKTQGGSFIRFMKSIAEQNGGEYIERG